MPVGEGSSSRRTPKCRKLAINSKTAKALGINVPATPLAPALAAVHESAGEAQKLT